ncbi:hypothetical protein [Pseudomonas sp. zfem002]|uniref:hypothetical protein n=1 Tax=Pseudomonas sp. zfem002 TaxID=3078197 RepID=UPI002929869A|nr:hypothetical protein [Pseudomonas sp. zfem002]MDU9389983.1 hypothetical protein [Pseudomonas sp. zfem002]
MPENLLTDAKIKSVKPADRDWKFSDGEGLFLLVNRLTYAMRDMNLGRGTTSHCWRTSFSTLGA